jgi:hypothetical protein
VRWEHGTDEGKSFTFVGATPLMNISCIHRPQ